MSAGAYVDDECMRTTYGVVWREGEEPLVAGKLELGPSGIRLDGLDGSRDIPYGLLEGVRVGRLAGERIDGRPSVVLVRHSRSADHDRHRRQAEPDGGDRRKARRAAARDELASAKQRALALRFALAIAL